MALIAKSEVTDIMLLPGELIKIRVSVIPKSEEKTVKTAHALSSKDSKSETMQYIWIK